MARALDDRAAGPFACTGGETLFGYDFEIASATGLAVWRRRGGADEPLVVGVDYTVGGVGSPAGGDVTLIEPAIAGDLYIILGDTACARVTNLSSERALKAQTLNREYDNLEFQIAELVAAHGRVLQRSPFDVAAGGVTLPAAQPNTLLGFDGDGNIDTFPLGAAGGGSGGGLADPLTIDDGGTGASTAAQARANLGVPGYSDIPGEVLEALSASSIAARSALGLGALALRDDVAAGQIAARAVGLEHMAAGMPGYLIGYDEATGLPEHVAPTGVVRVSGIGRHANGGGGATRHWIVDGNVYVAGSGASRQNGAAAATVVPLRVTFNVPPTLPIVSVVSGSGSTFMIDSAGRCYAMGENSNGQLGLGDTTDRMVATRIEALVTAGVTIAEAYPCPQTGGAITDAYAFFRATNGSVYAAGGNAYGQLGDGTTTARTTATVIPSLTGIAGLALSGSREPHTLAWTTAGQLYGTGRNQSGQLGDGTTTGRTTFAPIAVADCAQAIAHSNSVGGYSIVRRTGGIVAAAGYNAKGQLGQGDLTARSAFVSVTLAAAAAQLALAGSTVAARLTDGRVQLWGGNASGQCGTGAATDVTSPATPAGSWQTHALDVQLAGDDTGMVAYVRADDGEIYGAGIGTAGSVGTGSAAAVNATFAKLLGRTSTITAMSACGVDDLVGLSVLYDDGRAGGCGSNSTGELGHGTAGAHAFALTDTHLLNRHGPKGDVTPAATAAALAASASATAAANHAASAAGILGDIEALVDAEFYNIDGGAAASIFGGTAAIDCGGAV